MKIIDTFPAFNFRRYSNPWVAIVDRKTGKIDFSVSVGRYTGGHDKGEAGDLYVYDPQEGAVYAYGRKDYRGNNTYVSYVVYKNGEFVAISKTALVRHLIEEAQ